MSYRRAVTVIAASLAAASARTVRANFEALPASSVAVPAVAVGLALVASVYVTDAGFSDVAARFVTVAAGLALLGGYRVAVRSKRAGCTCAAAVHTHRAFTDSATVAAAVCIAASDALGASGIADLLFGAVRVGAAAGAAGVGCGVTDLSRTAAVCVFAAAHLTGLGGHVADVSRSARSVGAAACTAHQVVADVASATHRIRPAADLAREVLTDLSTATCSVAATAGEADSLGGVTDTSGAALAIGRTADFARRSREITVRLFGTWTGCWDRDASAFHADLVGKTCGAVFGATSVGLRTHSTIITGSHDSAIRADVIRWRGVALFRAAKQASGKEEQTERSGQPKDAHYQFLFIT